jgi:hypothetical protein
MQSYGTHSNSLHFQVYYWGTSIYRKSINKGKWEAGWKEKTDKGKEERKCGMNIREKSFP